MRTVAYGPHAAQVGDLHLPFQARPPVVCLLHGGFWRAPYGREQMDAVACDLVARGFAVWNLGYRRLGERGGGWPGSGDDVAAGVDQLARLAKSGVSLDLSQVAVVGHSAGGQLALWLAGRREGEVPVQLAIGLAAVSDLARAHALALGKGAAGEFLGGAPAQVPAHYAAASPRARLPTGVRQVLIHGADDTAVPVQMSRDYVAAARAAGDDVTVLELPGVGHMDFLQPDSAAHAALCAQLNFPAASRSCT